MTDPISIVAGIVGIASVVITSAKLLFELVDDITGVPEEVKSVSRAAHAFCSIIPSLDAILQEDEIRDVISGDGA